MKKYEEHQIAKKSPKSQETPKPKVQEVKKSTQTDATKKAELEKK